jgi:hypothetical protein
MVRCQYFVVCAFLLVLFGALVKVLEYRGISNLQRIRSADNCKCSKLEIFKRKDVDSAVSTRLQWAKALPFEIESEIVRFQNFSLPKNSDQEIPYGHARFNLLGPIAPKCPEFESYGEGREQFKACGLKNLFHKMEDCVIISLGAVEQWQFEKSIYASLPSCRIEVFNCTLPPAASPPKSIADRTSLHHVCAGYKDETKGDGQVFKSWPSILSSIRARQAPLFVRMSLGGYEYQLLRSIIDDARLMPIQMAVELTYVTQHPLPWRGRRKSSAEIATLMGYLHDQGGYFLVDRADSPSCPHCTQLLLSTLPCSCTAE